jgi:hypothetical protein
MAEYDVIGEIEISEGRYEHLGYVTYRAYAEEVEDRVMELERITGVVAKAQTQLGLLHSSEPCWKNFTTSTRLLMRKTLVWALPCSIKRNARLWYPKGIPSRVAIAPSRSFRASLRSAGIVGVCTCITFVLNTSFSSHSGN